MRPTDERVNTALSQASTLAHACACEALASNKRQPAVARDDEGRTL